MQVFTLRRKDGAVVAKGQRWATGACIAALPGWTITTN
jgi:hypothetical protein